MPLAQEPSPSQPAVIELHENGTQTRLGEISEHQLQFLIDHLEEESSDDQDYYINHATLEMLAEAGADPALLTVLRQGIGDREGLEVRWSRLQNRQGT